MFGFFLYFSFSLVYSCGKFFSLVNFTPKLCLFQFKVICNLKITFKKEKIEYIKLKMPVQHIHHKIRYFKHLQLDL